MNEWSDENIKRGIAAFIPSRDEMMQTIRTLSTACDLYQERSEYDAHRIVEYEARIEHLLAELHRADRRIVELLRLNQSLERDNADLKSKIVFCLGDE